MTCARTNQYPPLPAGVNGEAVDELRQEIWDNSRRCAPVYSYNPWLRTLAVVTVIGVIVAFALYVNGIFTQPIVPITHVDPLSLSLGLGIPGVLVLGVVLTLYRATHSKDRLGVNHHHIPHDSEWLPVQTRRIFKQYWGVDRARRDRIYKDHRWAYVDQSTLVDGTGEAYAYLSKGCGEHNHIAVAVFIVQPFVIVASMVYHSLRAVIAPLVLLAKMAYDHASQGRSDITLKRIGKECGESLFQVLQAPFCGVTIMGLELLALISPLKGRYLVQLVEREAWNLGAHLPEGFWIPPGLWGQPLWKGGNLFVPGCYQPVAIFKFESGKVKKVETTLHALNPDHPIFESYTDNVLDDECVTFQQVKARDEELRGQLHDLLHPEPI